MTVVDVTSAGLIDLWHDERLDVAEELVFVVAADDPKVSQLVEDGEIRWRDRRFITRQIETERRGTEIMVTVTCDGLWHRLSESVKVGSVVLSAVTTAVGLDTILAGTGWERGSGTTTSAATFSLEEQDVTVLELLRRWATITGTFVRFDTSRRRVELVASRGADLGIGFRYGRNLVSIARTVEAPYCTRLYAYGADGLSISGVNGGLPYVEDFTWYTGQGLSLSEARERFTKTRVFSDVGFVDDTALLSAAEARLARWAQPKVAYRCRVADLSELTAVREELAPGDEVRVQDEPLGIEVRTTVVRLRQYPLEPWRNEIELAYLPDQPEDGSAAARPQASLEWLLFRHDNAAEQQLRNDFTYLTNRIPLRFRTGGKAIYGVDVFATGVGGAGDLVINVIDALTDDVVYGPLTVPYASGEEVHGTLTWSADDLEGPYDYRIRVTADADSGPSSSLGVNIDERRSQFWILAHGAVREAPTLATSQTFDYTGANQTFTVPDGVTEITCEVVAARGGAGAGAAAAGGRVVGTFDVTGSEQFTVVVGGAPTGNDEEFGGWPNGGNAGIGTGGSAGRAGGGSSSIRRAADGFTSSLIVAPSAGGHGEAHNPPTRSKAGGNGGFFQGAAGEDTTNSPSRGGNGATQFAGGATPIGGGGSSAGGQDAGGVGEVSASSVTFKEGGGGGGWYGGSAGGQPAGASADSGGGGGAGGSGWIDTDLVHSIEITDGFNSTGDGYIVISWDAPDI